MNNNEVRVTIELKFNKRDLVSEKIFKEDFHENWFSFFKWFIKNEGWAGWSKVMSLSKGEPKVKEVEYTQRADGVSYE